MLGQKPSQPRRPVFHSLIVLLAEAKEATNTVRWWRKGTHRERSRPGTASKRRSRGRWSEWSIQVGAGWASGRACAPAWRPGWGSRPGTEGSGRVRPHASAGAWSWLRSPGSAGGRGYRRRASLLGQVEGEAGKGKKRVKAGVGVDLGDWARELCGSQAHREGLRTKQTGVGKGADNLHWAGSPYLCGLGSEFPSDA